VIIISSTQLRPPSSSSPGREGEQCYILSQNPTINPNTPHTQSPASSTSTTSQPKTHHAFHHLHPINRPPPLRPPRSLRIPPRTRPRRSKPHLPPLEPTNHGAAAPAGQRLPALDLCPILPHPRHRAAPHNLAAPPRRHRRPLRGDLRPQQARTAHKRVSGGYTTRNVPCSHRAEARCHEVPSARSRGEPGRR